MIGSNPEEYGFGWFTGVGVNCPLTFYAFFLLKDDLRVEILISHEYSKGRGSKWSGPWEVHADFVTKQSVRDIRFVGGTQFNGRKRWKGVIELNTSNKHLPFPLPSLFISLSMRWVLGSVACMPTMYAYERERESAGGVS